MLITGRARQTPCSMSDCRLVIRRGGVGDDELAVLRLFDEAIAWLVARDQAGQWGSQPFSERQVARERVHGFATGEGFYIAERDAETVGALVVGDAPDYARPAVPEPELYIELVLTSRRHAGQNIGGALLHHVVELARAEQVQQVRVDCWAGAPGLVAWYERQGFRRAEHFELGGWQGQILAMRL